MLHLYSTLTKVKKQQQLILTDSSLLEPRVFEAGAGTGQTDEQTTGSIRNGACGVWTVP